MIGHSKEGTRVWPILPPGLMVLDAGCGSGKVLNRCGGATRIGIDINMAQLQTGLRAFPACCFCCARGEALPFSAGTFDAVLSRVALPYMEVESALAEIARVLRPGGDFWCVLHPWWIVLRSLWSDVREADVKGVVYGCYVVLNGLTFNVLGRTFRYPLRRRRCESFQGRRGITRALLAAGFEAVAVTETLPFVVTARKRTVRTANEREQLSEQLRRQRGSGLAPVTTSQNSASQTKNLCGTMRPRGPTPALWPLE